MKNRIIEKQLHVVIFLIRNWVSKSIISIITIEPEYDSVKVRQCTYFFVSPSGHYLFLVNLIEQAVITT